MGNELLTSRDGLHWERAFRHGGHSSGDRHQPMVVGDRMLFRAADAVIGMPIDRIAYVSSWSNAIFDGASFKMKASGLHLNVRIPGIDHPIAGAPYVMCELIDDRDEVVDGYDWKGCILAPPLAGRYVGELIGATAPIWWAPAWRVRFYMREASIFAVNGD